MPTYSISGPDGKTYSIDGPDGASREQIIAKIQERQQVGGGQQQQKADVNPAVDFGRSIPRGAVSGFTGALANIGQSAALDAQYSGVPTADPASMPTGQQGMDEIEKATGPMYKPQGRAGRFGEAVGEGLGNPTSYIGPGGAALKIGGTILSSLGGEAGREATAGTGYEGAGSIAGSLLGGAGAAKYLAPTMPKAAVPTASELFERGGDLYKQAANSGLELHPNGIKQFAGAARQDLSNGPDYAFTGGQFGTAPKTFAALDALDNIPGNAKITARNIDTLRRHINDLSSEVQPTATPGVSEPTPDAVAAMALKDRLSDYLENLPQNHIVAGDPAAYNATIKEANANWAAGSRLSNVDARVTKAENAANRQKAGSLEDQIRSKVGSMLDNPQKLRGLNQDEIDQLQLINDGTRGQNVMRQLGRAGAGVLPMMFNLGTAGPAAWVTGGVSLPVQAAGMAALYGARRASQATTVSRAKALADMLAKRSPLYEQGAAELPPNMRPDAQRAAMARALINGTQQR